MKELEAQYQQKQKIDQLERRYQKGPISTITGKPVPTPAEEFSARKKLIAEGLPIAADIGLTALAPQTLGPRLGLKAPLAIKALNLAMRSLGAGAGGALGEYGRQKILGQPTDLSQMGLQGAIGAGSEILPAAGGAAVSGIKKAAKPIMNLIGEAPIIGSFSRPMVRAARIKQRKIREEGATKMFKFVEQFQETPGDIAGKKVGEALKGQMDLNEVYKPWSESVDRIAAEQGGVVPIDDASQMIGELFDKFQGNRRTEQETINKISRWLGFSGSKEKPMINGIIEDILEDGYLDPGDVKFLMSKFWKSYGKSTTAKANRWKESFKTAFLGDIDKLGHGAAQAKIYADKVAKANYQFIRESPTTETLLMGMNFGKSDIPYFEANPGRVTQAIFGKSDTLKNIANTRKDPESIMQLRNAVTNTTDGEKTWTAISFNYISDLINGSIKQVPDTGKYFIAPAEVAAKIRSAESTLRAALPAGTWNRLKNEANKLSDMARTIDNLEVNEAYDVFTAFGVLHPKAQNIIKEISKSGGLVGKPALKIAGHAIASQSQPQLKIAHGTK